MKKLLTIALLLIVFVSCKKDNVITPTTPLTPVQKEDSTIAIPAFSATLTANGSTRTINIIGGLTYIHFTSNVPYEGGKIGFITYIFDLKYDKLEVKKYPREIYDPTYTFVRNSPYNYTFTHQAKPGETYSVIINGKEFLEDTIQLKY